MHAAVGERYGHAAVRIAQNNANGVGVGRRTEVGGANQVGVKMSKVRLDMTERVVWTELGTRL